MSPECHRPQRSPKLCGDPGRGARIHRHFGVTAVGIGCACALSSGDFVSRNFFLGYPSTHAPWFIGMRVSPPWCLSHWGPGFPCCCGGEPWALEQDPWPSHAPCQEPPAPSRDIQKCLRTLPRVPGGEQLLWWRSTDTSGRSCVVMAAGKCSEGASVRDPLNKFYPMSAADTGIEQKIPA